MIDLFKPIDIKSILLWIVWTGVILAAIIIISFRTDDCLVTTVTETDFPSDSNIAKRVTTSYECT